VSAGALQLARLRAGRVVELTPEEHALAYRNAEALGRRLVELGRSGRARSCLLAWSTGAGPAAADERYAMRTLTPIPLLTFACCLRLCWPDPTVAVHPGGETSERAVLTLARKVTPADTHVKSALRRTLPAIGLIDFDEAGRCVRLGPEVASYDDVELAAMRRLHAQLPGGER
jgi:hypothetical protein